VACGYFVAKLQYFFRDLKIPLVGVVSLDSREKLISGLGRWSMAFEGELRNLGLFSAVDIDVKAESRWCP
jgi:hypothetical protein